MNSKTTVSTRIQGHLEGLAMIRQFFAVTFSGKLEPAALNFHVGESNSTIYWLAGHVTTALDQMGHGAAGRNGTLSPSFLKHFGQGTKPDFKAEGYPEFAEVLRKFDEVAASVASALENLEDEALDQSLPDNLPVKAIFPTVNALLHGLVFHTAYHLGQVGMLRRAQGIATGFNV